MPRRAMYSREQRVMFGQTLRRLIDEKGITAVGLARTTRLENGKTIHPSAISWYVNGRSVPTCAVLDALARVLEVDLRTMLPPRAR